MLIVPPAFSTAACAATMSSVRTPITAVALRPSGDALSPPSTPASTISL
jgi:hypothetical protein